MLMVDLGLVGLPHGGHPAGQHVNLQHPTSYLRMRTLMLCRLFSCNQIQARFIFIFLTSRT